MNMPVDLPITVALGPMRMVLRQCPAEVVEVAVDFAAMYNQMPQSPDPVTHMTVDITRNARSMMLRRRYDVWVDGEARFENRRAAELLPCLEWAINMQIIRTRNDFLQIHAATLSCDDGAMILTAESGSGKSTTAAGLCTAGWQYMCDEFALIEPRTLEAHPLPKALCVKAGSFDAIRAVGLSLHAERYYAKAFKGRVGYVAPHDLPGGLAVQPKPVRWILLPQYVAGAEPTLEPIARAAAVLSLAKQCFNRHIYQQRAIDMLSEVVRHAECYRLISGDLTATSQMITDQLRGRMHVRCAAHAA